jgi:hypothetical protein
MAKKSRPTGKTPGGVSLTELADNFKKQGKEVPPSVQKLLDEHMPAKSVPVAKNALTKNNDNKRQSVQRAKQAVGQKSVTPEAKEQTPAPATESTVSTTPEQKPTIAGSQEQKPVTDQEKPTNAGIPSKPNTGFARNFIKNLVGKDLAAKLIKRSSVESKKEDQREETTSKDIKAVKLTLEDLKKTLEAQGKKIPEKLQRKSSAVKKFTSAFASSFKRTAVKPLEKLGYKFERPKAEKIEKPKKIKGETVDKVPKQIAPLMAADLHEKFSQPQIQTSPQEKLPVPQKNEDQEKAQTVQTEVVHEKEAKAINDKLDLILKELDDIKHKQHGGMGMGILGMISAAIAGLWKKIKPIFDTVKTILNSVGKIWDVLKRFGSTMARFAAKLGVKIGDTLKGLGKNLLEGVGTAEVVAGAGAVAITAAGAYGIDRLAKYETDRAMKPAEALQKYGLKALGQGKFVLNGKQTTYDELPDDYKHLVGAMTGDTRGGYSKKEQEYVKEHSDLYKKLEIKTPQVAPVPKQLPERVAAASAQNTEMKSAQQSQPNVLVIKGGNTTKVMPSSKKSGSLAVQISTRNPESSISRLTSQMFDDPAGYSNISRL